ncbi:uncharacterized protein N7496_007613 [Penicillium cataractarum]|uniref:Amine oxidase domain-containing protein n=1 Tax=Penicillium cataractarum TaxID=2100454 RepID=A0A9W9S3V7_9EURO|nr:uncharacterized protein N7496_007613 [Penicillium cataractarum]KAJ5371521.1 hypothetical protein N7496_007613 [Penicillium cataractarum]
MFKLSLPRFLIFAHFWPVWPVYFVLCLSDVSSAIKLRFDSADVIVRDIAVVGGGASGTYAAIRLQQDFNKSVVVVEREKTLGGHTHTYHDPVTSSTIELGVVAFHDLPLVHDFFSRFDIPLTKLFFNSSLPSVDFHTGQPVYVPASLNATEGTFARWNRNLMRFPNLNEGYNFPLPVPDDIWRPFSQFAHIHNLTAIIPYIWTIDQGIGDILNLPTLYVMKSFGPQMLRSLSRGFLATVRQNNHEVYDKALVHLQETKSVLLNSSILDMDRDAPGPYGHAIIATPSGHKLVRVKQFLFTLPPTLDVLTGFDLDHEETLSFSCFERMDYFSGLLRNTPIPQNATFSNKATNPDTYYLPRLPTTYTLGPTNAQSSLTNVKFGSNISMSVEQVQSQIIDETGQVIPGKPARFEAFVNHGPYALRVSPELIRSGFYQRLNNLQGRRRSFWTGAAWHTHDSSLLWNFTETIISKMQQDWI